jgi:hypothetical protein
MVSFQDEKALAVSAAIKRASALLLLANAEAAALGVGGQAKSLKREGAHVRCADLSAFPHSYLPELHTYTHTRIHRLHCSTTLLRWEERGRAGETDCQATHFFFLSQSPRINKPSAFSPPIVPH